METDFMYEYLAGVLPFCFRNGKITGIISPIDFSLFS